MNFTKDQLEEIENMAELFYDPETIALNIEVDPEDFSFIIKSKKGTAYQAFFKGWLKGDIALLKSIQTAANNGSNPAQNAMLNFQRKVDL